MKDNAARILVQMQKQRASNDNRYREGEAIYTEPKTDVGLIKLLGDTTGPHRVFTYRNGYHNFSDPDLFKIVRTAIVPAPITNAPRVQRFVYHHDVLDVSTTKKVGEVWTRRWRSEGSGGNQWALMRIEFGGEVVFQMEGA